MALQVLNLNNIKFTHVQRNSFFSTNVKFIKTSDYKITCVNPVTSFCTSYPPWFVSCSDILPSMSIKTMYINISLLTIGLNILSILLHVLKLHKRISQTIPVIVIGQNFSDSLCGIYLTIIWVSDILLKGFYLVDEHLWKSHPLCFTGLCTVLWFTMSLLSLHQKHYISILGRHKSFGINCEGFIPPEMSQIYVTSHLEDYYNDFISRHLKFCHYQTQYMYCQLFRKNNLEYLVYGNVSNFYPHQHVDEKIYYSWLKGNRFCKRLGYELPYFMGGDELDDFISLLHGSGSIPYLEAVFVGLFDNNQKVSFCCIIDYN